MQILNPICTLPDTLNGCFKYNFHPFHGTSHSKYYAKNQIISQNTLILCQVTKEDKSFQNIMRCYRTQPQARSQVTTLSFRAENKDKSL